jgi:hypothetical protein
MRHGGHAVLALGLVLAATVPTRADDAAAARALVDKAVRAHGGEATLAKWPAVTAKLKGTFHGMGQAVAFTGEVVTQGADRLKLDIEAEAGGQTFRVVNVLNGDRGWARVGDETTELDKEQLAEAREQAHANWVATLLPLKDKAFTLATVGEVRIDGRPALGVKVSSQGHRDVDLYFDETGLLVKSETRVKDEGSGQEVTEESFLGDYQEVRGTKQSMKFTVKRDGKLYVEGVVTDCQLAESLDAGVFARP